MFQLLLIDDLREFDYLRNEYLPLVKGEGNICERCGREHAKVYVVRNLENNNEHRVGSTCCKKLLNWEPSKESVNALETQRKKTLQSEAKRRMNAFISETVAAMKRRFTYRKNVTYRQIEQMAAEAVATVLAGSKKQHSTTEKIIRKFLNTPCPMEIVG